MSEEHKLTSGVVCTNFSKNLNIDKLSTSKDVEIWLEVFEMSMVKYRVPSSLWVRELMLLCDEDVLKILRTLRVGWGTEYEIIKEKLITRFRPAQDPIGIQQKFFSRKQGVAESIRDYYEGVRNSAIEAYPEFPDENLDQLILSKFIAGLRSTFVKDGLSICGVVNLQDTYRKSLELEASEKRRNEEDASEPINCVVSKSIEQSETTSELSVNMIRKGDDNLKATIRNVVQEMFGEKLNPRRRINQDRQKEGFFIQIVRRLQSTKRNYNQKRLSLAKD
ncbi:hypothetical protein RF11_04876 [Thelohanellus kitauei]|uniref:Retrotransposon gag domain-containing protein n=1 Tax=Thelohanellus kitauei TaxID=669202 RepID=A0A0C2N112_THEKT|nr:hypothetical protein RF11_04876 [Thelohanellus kitauei]